MEVKACVFTDAGLRRRINQDSAMIKVANTKRHGRISFACVCDGMGGLSKGEVASCKTIRALETWFTQELPLMQNMERDELWKTVETSLGRLIVKVSGDIKRYGKHRGISLGSTMTALLQIGTGYMTVNIGDSRIYVIERDAAYAVTKDQSVLQDKIDRGLITLSQAKSDPERSILTQCIGTSVDIQPEIRRGSFSGPTTVIACSDGFWRTLEEKEIHDKLCPQMCVTADDMLIQCRKLSETAMARKEEDNISVAAMCLEY